MLNTYAVQKNYKIGYAQSWNVSVQQNLSRSFFIELSYLGTKGTDLDTETVPNRAALGSSPLTRSRICESPTRSNSFTTAPGAIRFITPGRCG